MGFTYSVEYVKLTHMAASTLTRRPNSAHAHYYPPLPPPPGNWPRAVIYCRQSKLNEDGSSASPLMQRDAGEGLCQARSYNPVACFTDAGKSGWNPAVVRPGFEEMMLWVRERKCDVVIIYTLSRLTRQGALEAMQIEAEMRKHGVALVSVREPYLDTSDPVGIGIFAIIAGLAKQESDGKSEYIKNTRELARKAGGHISGNPPYGFRSEKTKTSDNVAWVRLVAVEAEARTVRQMAEWAMGGVTTGKIADRLNALKHTPTPAERATHKGREYRIGKSNGKDVARHWTSTQVLRILRDPRIAGMAGDKTGPAGSYTFAIRRGDDGQPMHVHDQIITPANWYMLQEALGEGGKWRREAPAGTTTLLSGWNFLVCECGANHTSGNPGAKTGAAYRCGRAAGARKLLKPAHTINSVRRGAADDHVARSVFDRMLNLDPEDPEDGALIAETARRFAHQIDTEGHAQELREHRAQLAHTEESLAHIYADRRAGLYAGKVGQTAFAEAVGAMQRTEAQCRALIAELEAEQTATVVLPVNSWFDADASPDPIGPGSVWASWGITERREFLSLWVDRVVVQQAPDRRHVPIEARLDIQWATAPTE